jgi:anti-sigma28 factor (negative regulator of flagellin synthesis)
MKAVRNNSARANLQGMRSEQPDTLPLSPEHSDSASSGTYFRAVRPTEAEAAAVARGEHVVDGAKVRRLCTTLEAGSWHADSDVIAQRIIDDAE